MRCTACDNLLEDLPEELNVPQHYNDLCFTCISSVLEPRDIPDRDAVVAMNILKNKRKVK